MAITLNIVAENPEDLRDQLSRLMNMLDTVDTMVTLPKENIPERTEIKPVISQARMEENVKNAPAHEMPPVPTLQEVRDALKQLRDKKGAEAVRAILKEYNADSVPNLKEEDYLIVRDRALAEVG